jgi:ATP-dependent Zn protease
MAWLMDQEIRDLILSAESKAEKILTSKRAALEKLAEELMKEEVLDKNDIDRIIKKADAQ